MSNRRRANQDKEMLHVAEMYYFEQMTHAAIAQRLSISRWTVGRILEEARRTGMVKITIDHPLARYHRFETELVDTFGLQSAVVVPVQANDELTMEFVTRMAAQRLSEWRPPAPALSRASHWPPCSPTPPTPLRGPRMP